MTMYLLRSSGHPMRLFSLTLIVGFLLSAGCCTMQPKASEREANPDTAASTTSSVIPPQPTPADKLPPGTTHLRATVADCMEETGRYVCTLTVQNVKGYGAATTPIAAETALQAFFPKATMPTDVSTLLAATSEVEVLVQRNQTMGAAVEAPTWTVVRMY